MGTTGDALRTLALPLPPLRRAIRSVGTTGSQRAEQLQLPRQQLASWTGIGPGANGPAGPAWRCLVLECLVLECLVLVLVPGMPGATLLQSECDRQWLLSGAATGAATRIRLGRAGTAVGAVDRWFVSLGTAALEAVSLKG